MHSIRISNDSRVGRNCFDRFLESLLLLYRASQIAEETGRAFVVLQILPDSSELQVGFIRTEDGSVIDDLKFAFPREQVRELTEEEVQILFQLS